MANAEVELPYKTARDRLGDTGNSPGSETGNSPGSTNQTLPVSSPTLGMDKSTLKVHLPNGSFNVVRFGDATDIKVSLTSKLISRVPYLKPESEFQISGNHPLADFKNGEWREAVFQHLRHENDQPKFRRNCLVAPGHDNVSSKGYIRPEQNDMIQRGFPF